MDCEYFLCGEPKCTLMCSKCKKVYYCNKECQSSHWKWHKLVCDPDISTIEQRKKEVILYRNAKQAKLGFNILSEEEMTKINEEFPDRITKRKKKQMEEELEYRRGRALGKS